MGPAMNDFMSAIFTLAMLAAVVLAVAGVKLALKRETRVRGILMVVAAAVLVMNVTIATV